MKTWAGRWAAAADGDESEEDEAKGDEEEAAAEAADEAADEAANEAATAAEAAAVMAQASGAGAMDEDAPASGGGRGGDSKEATRSVDVIIGEMKHTTDVQKLKEKTVAGKRRDRPVGELRRVVQHLSAGFLLQDGADKWVKRSLLAKEIKKKLELKTEKKEKSAAAKVKMDLHRLNQLLWYCYFRWDGKERWRGGPIRATVVRLCKN